MNAIHFGFVVRMLSYCYDLKGFVVIQSSFVKTLEFQLKRYKEAEYTSVSTYSE